mmetsp:Transcript_7616/g.21451  ORF Transcript_7616/g.21451 Transcript_7616/m.21451 type:complete len:159 (+) Transcript_7616:667-1143(+)
MLERREPVPRSICGPPVQKRSSGSAPAGRGGGISGAPEGSEAETSNDKSLGLNSSSAPMTLVYRRTWGSPADATPRLLLTDRRLLPAREASGWKESVDLRMGLRPARDVLVEPSAPVRLLLLFKRLGWGELLGAAGSGLERLSGLKAPPGDREAAMAG